MFGDIYPTNYMGQTTDIFGRLKFRLPVNLQFLAKSYAADRATKIVLLMLVMEVMVISRLKNIQWYIYGIYGIS